MNVGSTEKGSDRSLEYRFGEFVVYPADRVLVRNGEEVSLRAKVFDLLVVFVTNPGRLLTKDELIEEIWPESFVEEGNLARNVSTLRKIIEDTDKENRLILTVQGKGYRFTARVTQAGSDQERSPRAVGSGNPEVGENRYMDTASAFVRRHWVPLLFLIGTIGILAAALRSGPGWSSENSQFTSQLGQRRLTHSGKVVAGTISRDGKYIAYAKSNGGDRTLYVRQVESENPLELVPGKPGASYWAVDISPDDGFVYYITKELNTPTGRIYRTPLLGGPRELLVAHADGCLTLSEDGRQMAFTRIERDEGTISVIIADNDGKNERVLRIARLESMFYSLDWAPDDKSLLVVFMKYRPEGNRWQISELPVSGGAEKMIGEPYKTRLLTARWVNGKKGMVINRNDEATRLPQIFFLSYPDLTERQITYDPEGNLGVEVTDDGQSLLTAEQTSTRRIWVQDKEASEKFRPVTGGTELHHDGVSWLGDDRLVFDEDENGSYDLFNIWTANADGSGRKQLTHGPGYNYQPVAPPNGDRIAFVSKRAGSRQLWAMTPDGENQRLVAAMEGDVFHPQYTLDGKWLFYEVHAGGLTSVWKVPADGGVPIRVLPPGVLDWAVSPTGLSICYSAFGPDAAGSRTYLRSLVGDGSERQIDIEPESWIQWRDGERAVVFDSRSDGGRNVWEYSISDGQTKRVTDFEDERVFRCAESPNEHRSACIRATFANDLLLISTGLGSE